MFSFSFPFFTLSFLLSFAVDFRFSVSFSFSSFLLTIGNLHVCRLVLCSTVCVGFFLLVFLDAVGFHSFKRQKTRLSRVPIRHKGTDSDLFWLWPGVTDFSLPFFCFFFDDHLSLELFIWKPLFLMWQNVKLSVFLSLTPRILDIPELISLIVV